jgi:nitrate reductase beta subunit
MLNDNNFVEVMLKIKSDVDGLELFYLNKMCTHIPKNNILKKCFSAMRLHL